MAGHSRPADRPPGARGRTQAPRHVHRRGEQRGLHHLVWEVLDNSVDEAMNGQRDHADAPQVKDTVTVADNGRGIPVDRNKKTGKSGPELVLTELHAGGKFQNDGDGNYKTSGGLHGVGASVVNALSKKLTVVVRRDGGQYKMDFARGVAATKLLKAKGKEVRGSGTTITFTPDPKIFPKTTFNPETLQQRLETAAFLHSNVKMVFVDEVAGKRTVFRHENGIRDYLEDVGKSRSASPIHGEPFFLAKETPDARVEMVFQWTDSTDEHVRSYATASPPALAGATRTASARGSTRPSGTTSRPTSSPLAG